MKAGKPIFGICRVCQLINVALSGTLIQYLDCTKFHKVEGGDVTHGVVSQKESLFDKIYGKKFTLNSIRHQGEGLRIALRSDQEGIVEGYEHVSLPIIGAQFHPERMCLEPKKEGVVDGLKLFEHFVYLCQRKV